MSSKVAIPFLTPHAEVHRTCDASKRPFPAALRGLGSAKAPQGEVGRSPYSHYSLFAIRSFFSTHYSLFASHYSLFILFSSSICAKLGFMKQAVRWFPIWVASRVVFWLAALSMVFAVSMGGGAARSQITERNCGNFLQCLFDRGNGSSAVTGRKRLGRSTAEVISWPEAAKYASGSIIVRTPERRLYYVLGGGKVLRYKVGVGREGFQWSGTSRIVAKQEWPHWRPPEEMIRREAAKGRNLPEDMAGGPNNPLGARALYIGGTLYRIHGSNDAASIGRASSSGCIRMLNADVMELYDRVKIGARVYVYQ